MNKCCEPGSGIIRSGSGNNGSSNNIVADPYSGSEKIRYGSGSRPNFDTDTDPNPGKKGLNARNI